MKPSVRAVLRLISRSRFSALLAGVLTTVAPLRAVYAPIPEQEQGKDLTVSVRAAVSYDSNIFAAPPPGSIPGGAGPIDSMVYTLAPRVSYNASLTAQTFFAGSYALTLDEFDKRPGEKLLDSHDLSLRLAHAFSKVTTIDATESFMVVRNPEAPLTGLPLLPNGQPQTNPDQSFRRNQIDGRFNTPLGPKVGLVLKARSVDFDYHRNPTLARSLNRIENLYGVSGDYAVLPETHVVAELRHQDIYYWTEGELKNKRSNYAMAGVDYAVAQKLSVSARLGSEWRHRSQAASATNPYAEVSGKYDYAPDSFLVFGGSYGFEETTDLTRFTDTNVQRYFANIQHAITKLIAISGSLSYEPSTLQSKDRALQPDVDETTVRAGLAASYLPTKNWVVSASYDDDRVWSGLASRELRRHRYGVSASYSF